MRLWSGGVRPCNHHNITSGRKSNSACTWRWGGHHILCGILYEYLRPGSPLHAGFHDAGNHHPGGRSSPGRNDWEYGGNAGKYASGSLIYSGDGNGSGRSGGCNGNWKFCRDAVLCLFYGKESGCTEYGHPPCREEFFQAALHSGIGNA